MNIGIDIDGVLTDIEHMDVKILQDVIREYNSHEEEIFDNATGIFISKVRSEFEKQN